MPHRAKEAASGEVAPFSTMDVENRHIKEEVASEHRVTTGESETCGGETDDREAAPPPTESETGNDDRIAPHDRAPRMIYSLNMNVCRLCLSEGHGHLQPVFYAQDSPDEILLQKILELTTVEITYATDFPTGVCIECLAKLDMFSVFRRQCVENNELLKLKYYELKAEADAEDYPCHPDKPDPSETERVLHLAKVKQEEKEFIELEGAADRHNGGALGADDVMDETDGHVPFVGAEAAGNEIIIGEGPNCAEYGEQQPPEQSMAGTKIQYVSEDGTMTEYITAGAIVRRDEVDEANGDGGGGGGGHEIYYTVGTDTYAIPATGEEDGTAVNYVVPPGYADQTEIECTTIDDHLPEEYVEEGTAALPMATGGVVMAAAAGAVTSAGGPNVALVAASRGRHDRPFVCKHCKTSFKYEHNYDRHMKNHAKVLYRCGKCSKTFVKLRKCQQHFLKAHSSQRYECDICYRTYSLPTRLENHVIEMHSVNGVYRCDRCQGELFSSYLDFKAHRLRYHPRTSEASAGTGAAGGATVLTDLTAAIIKQTQFGAVVRMEHVPPPTFATTQLSSPGSPTPSSESDDGPQSTAAAEQPVRAKRQYSGASSRARGRANGHSNSNRTAGQRGSRPHTISPSSASQQPPAEVILIDDDAEQQQHHGQPDPLLPNGTDRAPTVHRELLQQIEESEANATGPKVYHCESCRKTFVHLNNLKAHIYAEHDNDKPFKCKLCPISFKTKEILVMHMLLHTQNTSAT
uniref:Ovo n=1 Tax=Anopheles farauti TaxID=69004 RepID=A0A182QPA9_9DIPT